MQHNKLIRPLIGLVLLIMASTVYGQICNSSVKVTAPDSRYQDNDDGTVTDLYTGLMWQRCSRGLGGDGCATGSAWSFSWGYALQELEDLNEIDSYAGYSDWRLPNSKELESLVEEACYSPAINVTLFPNTPEVVYWSSSPFNSDSAWVVDFSDGRVHHEGTYPGSSNYVRLVRSTQ